MVRFFTRERFGRPQVLAACLLLVFLAQCLWLVGKGVRPGTVDLAEIYRLRTWHRALERPAVHDRCRCCRRRRASSIPRTEDSGTAVDVWPEPESSAYDANHSPLWYLIAAAPLWLRPVSLQPENIRSSALVWPPFPI